jgi:hypothetical protein
MPMGHGFEFAVLIFDRLLSGRNAEIQGDALTHCGDPSKGHHEGYETQPY